MEIAHAWHRIDAAIDRSNIAFHTSHILIGQNDETMNEERQQTRAIKCREQFSFGNGQVDAVNTDERFAFIGMFAERSKFIALTL